ncbi:MAG: DUF1330 domain-containing protein [Devosia sp.]
MAKGYWIAHMDVSDPEGYKDYVALNAGPFAKFGARFLARGGTFEAPEGEARKRHVIIEFPSYQAALDCYDSEGYKAATAVRKKHAVGEVVIIEGYEGAQPGQ